MTHPSWTWSAAVDPATPPEDLARIVAEQPELRAAVATNPAAYPALVDWLASLGDPVIDEALRAAGRTSAAGAAPAAGSAPGSSDAYGYPTVGETASASGYLAAQTGYAPPTGYATPAVFPTGGGYARPTSSNRGGAVVGIVIGAVVALAVAFGIGFGVGRATADDAPGSLHSRCAGGDMLACDDLWYETPGGSSEEQFAGTCGNRATYEGATCQWRYGDRW